MKARRPILLGIVGDSAAGKTTVARGLVELLGRERVTHVCTDDYHRYDRRERAELGITALHPDCNYLDILELQLERLHYGQPILKPVYDHKTGTLVRPEYVRPREFVIVEGLLGFHTAAMRSFYDVKVFLDPPEALRRLWKVKRDTAKRGYTAEQVLAEIEKREADSRDFIRPQRDHADVVVQFFPRADRPPLEQNGHLSVRLVLRPTVPHPDLSYLFDAGGGGVRLELGRDRLRPVDILEIDGRVTAENAQRLERVILDHFPEPPPFAADGLGNYQDGTEARQSDPLALTQVLLAYHLHRAYGDGAEIPFARPIAALSRIDGALPGAADDAGVTIEEPSLRESTP